MQMEQRIGFVGVGNMGNPMARRLLDAGYQLIVFDASAEAVGDLAAAGARSASSVESLGKEAEIVFVSVPTPEIVRTVALGLIAGGRVKYVVDLSTTGPDMSKLVAQDLAESGAELIDCPVSGGVAGARVGKLALMVGASEVALAKVEPLLACFGQIFHVGSAPGMGQMMKVINNLMSASALTASAEGVTMAVKAGLDAETVVNVLNAGSGRSSATLDKFPRQILTRSFDAGFSIGLMVKDVKLCLGQAKSMGLDLPASDVVATIWEQAERALGGEADFTRIVQMAEQSAGIEIVGHHIAASSDRAA